LQVPCTLTPGDYANLCAAGEPYVSPTCICLQHVCCRKAKWLTNMHMCPVCVLQELPWRRIDVSFQGARFGFAHNNVSLAGLLTPSVGSCLEGTGTEGMWYQKKVIPCCFMGVHAAGCHLPFWHHMLCCADTPCAMLTQHAVLCLTCVTDPSHAALVEL
jgi:hypothetical protein